MTTFLLLLVLAAGQAEEELQDRLIRDFCSGVRAARGDLDELRGLGEPARRALLELAASDEPAKGCAFELLANLNDRRVIVPLRESLGDESELPPVRRQAVAFLGRFEDRQSLDEILALFESGDHGMKMSALSALGAIDDERARRALRAAVTDPRHQDVLPTILRSIGRQRDPGATPVLLAVAGDENALSRPVVGNQLRYELALAFARIGTRESHRHAVAMVGSIANEPKQRLTIRDVGREIRRQQKTADDPERRAEMDAHLAELARMYRELGEVP